MAQGYQADKARKEAVNALGRELARRSKSRCEFCGAAGRPLEVLEVLPLPDRPDPTRAVLLCEPCAEGGRGGRLEPYERWRFLEETVWSDVPAVQVMAVRVAKRLQRANVVWVQDLLSGLYLDPEIEAWAGQSG